MTYELRLPPDTRNEIAAYLAETTATPSAFMEGAQAILAEFAKLEVNPLLGEPLYGTPFEGRRIHRFVIVAGNVHRTLAVLYKIFEKDHLVAIHGFQRQGL